MASKTRLPLQMLMNTTSQTHHSMAKSLSAIPSNQLSIAYFHVLIKSNHPQKTAAHISTLGGHVGTVIGSIITARMPANAINALNTDNTVEAIEASHQLIPSMDTARHNTGVSTLHTGVNGTQYHGKDIIIGIIDSGLDYSHSDFLDENNQSRVQYFAYQSVSTGQTTACAHDTIIAGTCAIPTKNDTAIGHGTHVTGIAASANTTYTGIAPKSDIMFFRNDFSNDINEIAGSYTAGLLDGVVAIFSAADKLDKPAVINISQGSHIGAHDNTSLLEQGLNSAIQGKYAENGKNYGRAIVVAAGNEYVVSNLLDKGDMRNLSGGIHSSFDIKKNQSQARRLWIVNPKAPRRTPLLIDIWFDIGQQNNCHIAANAYSYHTIVSGNVSTNHTISAIADMPLSEDNTADDSDTRIALLASTDASDALNSKPRALIGFGPGNASSWTDIAVDPTTNDGYVLDIIIRASNNTCSGNMWIEGGGTYVNFQKNITASRYNVSNGSHGHGYTLNDGDNNMTVAIPGTASEVITVGAFTQQKPLGNEQISTWQDSQQNTYDATDITNSPTTAIVYGGSIGSRCPFSSIGPTADNRLKPDILAPGDPIISSLPAGFNLSNYPPLIVDNTHYKSQGTSQASPHIAGIIALMFEKNNRLTADEIKRALISTGSKASNADYHNGYGRTNAIHALASISEEHDGYTGTGNLGQSDLTSLTNPISNDSPAQSSNGCSMIGNSQYMPFLILAALIQFVYIKRRLKP